jgi:hypothetical protein
MAREYLAPHLPMREPHVDIITHAGPACHCLPYACAEMASDVQKLRHIVDRRLRDKAQRVSDDDLATLVKKGFHTEADLAAAPAYLLSSAVGGLLNPFIIHTLLEEFNHGELGAFQQLQGSGSCFAPSDLTPISSADGNWQTCFA